MPHTDEQQDRAGWVYDWFGQRGISAETVDAFGCYGAQHRFPAGGEQSCVVFPYRFERRLVNRKYRSLDKQLMQDKNPLPTLFNVDAIELSKEVPDPDLIIRTSGEQRLSNFLLWQAAYAEFWFTETLWPDFGANDLAQAVAEYARRERRYGAG